MFTKYQLVSSSDSKVKSLYLTSVVPSATRLVSMEADGTPFTTLPLSVVRFKMYLRLQLHGSEESRNSR